VKSFISWIYGFALAIGGPGLFVIAFLDSSFVSLPQINDLLVVLMVTQNKAWMLYYALMATLGSIAGCYLIYYLAEKGGEAFMRKRRRPGPTTERVLALYKRHGLLALMVPALLPPPAPFKLFVLMAGVAGVPPVQFIAAIGVARGLRYLILGMLAIWYGDLALEYMRTHGRAVALTLIGILLLGVTAWWVFNRRKRSAS
jgi:membrane protein YqaA with SNARE-associated domain